jgi:DNA-binding NarL/FixJ family response regulator
MKILLVDDHPLFREGLALLLARLEDGLELLQAGTCEEALPLCESNPDIGLVLLDLNLGGMHGLEGLALLRGRHPGIPVVVMSSEEERATVRRAIDLGAMGFIPKSSSSEVMLNALRLVLAKGIYLPPAVLKGDLGREGGLAVGPREVQGRDESVTPASLGLTARQIEVLYLVLQGKPVKLICRELDLGETTVKGHISAVLRALNVTTRTEAIVAAHRLGLRFDATPLGGGVKRRTKSA